MNAHTVIAKPRASRAKLSLPQPKPDAPAAASPPRIVPSSPEPIALRYLRRAPENVRHHRIDEDVPVLAEDIAAHGLLQSLIGYRDGELVQIVGGGRRFQALRHLEDEGALDADFPVPVLIRSVDEAIELSLAENLQQRTMSPVDEYLAFQALMERGTQSPADLAKRFGFSERVVKQRLRLAQLEPEVLDALAEKKITIDAAMAYASSQDRELQREVFRAEIKRSKSYRDAHRPNDIRHAMRMKGQTTEDPLFRYVGAATYEAAGGGYEDDLFLDGKDAAKTLSHPYLLQELGRKAIGYEAECVLDDWRARKDLAPTIVGWVATDNLRVHSWGNAAKAPRGFVRIEKHDVSRVWKTIRNNGLDAHVLLGIDHKGELSLVRDVVYVPTAQKDAVDPPPAAYRPQTPEERAAETREAEIKRLQRRLAVGPFTGTPWEDRAFWRGGYGGNPEPRVIDGVSGWLVPVDIFVTEAAIDAQRAAAEVAYEQEAAEKKAAEEARAAARARADELRAMEPPAVVVVDGLAWERREDGSYAPLEDAEDGFLPSWTTVLTNFDVADIGDVFATRAAFDERQAAAIGAEEEA